jgi:hypothetical protein
MVLVARPTPSILGSIEPAFNHHPTFVGRIKMKATHTVGTALFPENGHECVDHKITNKQRIL